jgi:predicted DsbA family dithiol-disulfide isomerase
MLDAGALAGAIRGRKVSCVEVMNAYLDHIEKLNPKVNAIVALQDRADLLVQAREKDVALARGEPVGPLHGFPHAVKGLAPVKGIPTTMGSPILKDNVPTADSVMVARLRQAGAIFIGKNAQRIVLAARQEGLAYNPDAIARQPNTLDCHRLILWAGLDGNGARMKQRLMALYFSEGGDLTDREVLVKAAADCGLDPARVRELLAGDQDVDQVTAEANSAKEAGIDGVPCFIFGGLFAVSGAQAPEYLARAIERAAAELDGREAAE